MGRWWLGRPEFEPRGLGEIPRFPGIPPGAIASWADLAYVIETHSQYQEDRV